MTTALKAAQATADHWGLATKSCLEAMGRLPKDSNFGLVYVTEGFADDLSSVVTLLRETTHISHWLGAVGHGVFGPIGEVFDKPAVAVMVGRMAAGGVRPFERFDPENRGAFLADHGDWLADQAAVTALVHGDPREPAIVSMVEELAEAGHAFVVGGLTVASDAPTQVSGRVNGSGLSGAMFGDSIHLAIGLTQGCTPIGGLHRVTEVADNVVMTLDDQPALDILKAEAGDIIARDLQKAAGYIHIALPIEGSDNLDYVVRGLLAVDPHRGWLAITRRLEVGDRMMFVRRDPNAAQKDMARMLAGLSDRTKGRTIKGGIYISCVGRGASMFGRAGRETEMIRHSLGDFPLVGFAASGEICRDRLYGYTGVLTLFL